MVIGWNKDDLTDEEFWLFVRTIKDLGRLEEWTPPEGYGREQASDAEPLPLYRRLRLLVHPSRVPMLNREHVSVQQATPTRRVVER